MRIGNESINEKFFAGWKFKEFEQFIKSTGMEKGTGLSVIDLAKRLDIEVPKKLKGEDT